MLQNIETPTHTELDAVPTTLAIHALPVAAATLAGKRSMEASL
jgi:hypothetical protein